MLLQALLGAWPHELLGSVSEGAAASFLGRMEEYARKALREGKRHSSWVNVNEPYEEAVFNLLRSLLAPHGEFLSAFRPLARRLAYHGVLTGLARTALKCTLPGVPDVYQGTEFWDLSLVDPDNRRPVDYAARSRALTGDGDPAALLRNWPDGHLKQFVLGRLLADRAEWPEFYAGADYQRLPAAGARAGHILAFRRARGEDALIVAVPRLLAPLTGGENPPLGQAFWNNTSLSAGEGRCRDIITGVELAFGEEGLRAGELFSVLPIAVLRTMP
jgi:(1->4)-alpha-D-glucan 1-alpha-D-glucosylmutase